MSKNLPSPAAAADEEELEPLFNYPTVLPLDLLAFEDDRFKCSPPSQHSKPQKNFKVKRNDEDVAPEKKLKVDLEIGSEDDEDWLASPPPRIPNGGLIGKEDETLRKLRLQKQELISFTQSAKNILQKAAMTKKDDISNPSLEVVLDKQSKQQGARPKIVISIQDKDGQKQFRMYSDDKFEKLFKMYAEKVQVKLDRLIFTFDGDKVSPSSAPGVLGMEDDDILEVHMR